MASAWNKLATPGQVVPMRIRKNKDLIFDISPVGRIVCLEAGNCSAVTRRLERYICSVNDFM